MGQAHTIESPDGKRRAEVTAAHELKIAGQILTDILNAINNSGGGGLVGKILQNLQPGSTAAPIYTLPASKQATIKTMMICNTGAVDATFRIHLDPDGNTYNAGNALFYDVDITAKETKQVDIQLDLGIEGGSVGVQASTNDVTFTVSGEEKDV